MRIHRPPAGEPDGMDEQALLRLAEKVDTLGRQVEDLTLLKSDVDTHTRTLADLTDLLRRVSGAPAEVGPSNAAKDDDPPVMEWLTITDPQVAVRFLTDLSVWVRDVFARYVPAGSVFAPCWPWHPTVVAELLACQAAWLGAVDPKAPLEALAGWHDRWRPGTWQRLDKLLARCERDVDGLHIEGAARYRFDLAYLDELAEWWATCRQVTPPETAGGVAPGLTLHLVTAPTRTAARPGTRETAGGRP